ncbi:hypothetical protein PQR02_21180 [Paraburkholderia sediminicola]|uniref:Uncharacterized protein n=1 Tax=Paraburkholderia rhynchosiae TaxID=487049 RepID=A0ACC7NEL9_9BURK
MRRALSSGLSSVHHDSGPAPPLGDRCADNGIEVVGLFGYWLDVTQRHAAHGNVETVGHWMRGAVLTIE